MSPHTLADGKASLDPLRSVQFSRVGTARSVYMSLFSKVVTFFGQELMRQGTEGTPTDKDAASC